MARKILVLQEILLQQTECFRPRQLRKGIPRVCFYFFPGNGIPSCWLFRGMVWNRNQRVCFYFCSTERNSELFSLPRNGSERNHESLLLFFFHSTEFQAFFPLRNGSERNSESFLFCGTAGIPPEQTNCSVYSVFRGIIFSLEIANPIWSQICENIQTAELACAKFAPSVPKQAKAPVTMFQPQDLDIMPANVSSFTQVNRIKLSKKQSNKIFGYGFLFIYPSLY
jgi:hypothetical protein